MPVQNKMPDSIWYKSAVDSVGLLFYMLYDVRSMCDNAYKHRNMAH